MKSLAASLLLPAFIFGFSLHEYLPVPTLLTYFVVLVYLLFMFKLYQEKQQRKEKWHREIQQFSFPTKNGTKIRVVSYNIFLRYFIGQLLIPRPPLVNNNGDDFKNERFREFMKLIDNFDVIALQV